MATIVTHQPRPVRAFRRQHSTSHPPIPNPSQSSLLFSSSMDLHSRPYRPNCPPQFSSSNHHIPHTPPHRHHPYYSQQQCPNMTATTVSASFARRTSPPLSSTYPLVYSPSENSYSAPSMSADLQHEYPFDIGFATGPGMDFADLDLSQSAHGRPASAPALVHPSDMSPSPPAFGDHVPYPRLQGSSSPPGLRGESNEALASASSESHISELSDGPDGDDDGDFLPNRTSRSRTRSRRDSSGSGRPIRPCRLSAPVPVPNLTKKSRGRRVPTTPVFMVQGGVQKVMRMYKCMVDGCNKSFARGEHLKRHVRSIHTNEKCAFVSLLSLGLRTDLGDPVIAHKCPVEGCGKDFSRHDDLGQHMRVHKGQVKTNVWDA